MQKYRKDLFGNPIVNCWISADGHFAFAEFRSVEDMEAGFALGNCTLFGRPLKVGRTKHSTSNAGVTAVKPSTVTGHSEENRPLIYLLKIIPALERLEMHALISLFAKPRGFQVVVQHDVCFARFACEETAFSVINTLKLLQLRSEDEQS